MKNLFLVDGASGTGKTDMIKYVSENKFGVSYIKKYTTRKIRQYEKESKDKLDLIPITEEEFADLSLEYCYSYGGFRYGFSKNELFKKIKDSKSVFVIVRDTDLIEQLKKDFVGINVVSVFVYTDRDKIIDRLKNDNHDDDDIDFRIRRLGVAYKAYLDNPDFYDEVIVNSGSKDDYQRILAKMLSKYKKSPELDLCHIFVLMSFKDEYDEVYEEFVDAAKLVDEALVVKRIDKQRGDFSITNEIINNINKSGLIICDLTDERPNVYYELGYARGIGKKVIICAREGTKLHFDIKDFNTIIYRTTSHLRREISEELKEFLSANPTYKLSR